MRKCIYGSFFSAIVEEANVRKYSVLMSVYYKEKPIWLKESIESMLSQTVAAEEFFVVKDGKLTEELDDVIDYYVKKFPQLFTVLSLEANVGLGPALAEGVKRCRNEIIIRMDSDDYSVPERCEKLLQKLDEHPEYGIIGSFEAEFSDDITNPIAIHTVPESYEQIRTFMRRRCAILHPTVLYKKRTILNCGNYHDVHLYEDYDLFMRAVLEYKVQSCNIQETLYFIRINDDFFKRRGGISYMITVVKFKWRQHRKGYISLSDFLISAGGQAVVCILPNKMRKWIYLNFLR